MTRTTLRRDEHRATRAAEIIKALGHPLRLRIIAVLCDTDEHVTGLAEQLGVKHSIVSQQLRILRMQGLVEAVRANGHATYRLAEPQMRQLVACIEACSLD